MLTFCIYAYFTVFMETHKCMYYCLQCRLILCNIFKRALAVSNELFAIKYCGRLIIENFTNDDIWMTLTYAEGNEPACWDEAVKNMTNYIRRINYRRKKLGLPKAKYIYVTEHDPSAYVSVIHISSFVKFSIINLPQYFMAFLLFRFL